MNISLWKRHKRLHLVFPLLVLPLLFVLSASADDSLTGVWKQHKPKGYDKYQGKIGCLYFLQLNADSSFRSNKKRTKNYMPQNVRNAQMDTTAYSEGRYGSTDSTITLVVEENGVPVDTILYQYTKTPTDSLFFSAGELRMNCLGTQSLLDSIMRLNKYE